jgi:hypothetical protein
MKNGIISNKKEKYCDLLYVQKEQNQLIEWIEHMEISCKDMIDNKKKLWFQSDLTRDDIDNMMTPLYRLYKSGINVLIRTYIDVNKHNQKPKCLIYNEDENEIDISCLDNSQKIIPLLHIEGIRFSSKTFELDIKLTQIMVMDKEEEDKPLCMIKKDLHIEKRENNTSLGKEVEKKNNVSFVDDGIEEEGKKNKKDLGSNIILANEVTNKVANEVANEVVNEVANEVVNEVVNEVANEVVNEVANEVVNEVANEVVNEVVNEVANKVANKVANEVANEVVNEVANEVVNEVANEVVNEVVNEEIPSDEIPLNEVSFDNLESLNKSEVLELKKPNQVYYKIYKAARRKAIIMRQKAIEAFLEAKKIKTKYMLQHLDDSDSEDNSEDEDFINEL